MSVSFYHQQHPTKGGPGGPIVGSRSYSVSLPKRLLYAIADASTQMAFMRGTFEGTGHFQTILQRRSRQKGTTCEHRTLIGLMGAQVQLSETVRTIQ